MSFKIDSLKKRKDFERVFKKGKGVKEDFLALKLLKTNDELRSSQHFANARVKEEQIRVGLIVSKKVAKKAVVRNKIKRRLRAIIRSKVEESSPKQGMDLVFIVFPGLEKKNFQELEETVTRLFLKCSDFF